MSKGVPVFVFFFSEGFTVARPLNSGSEGRAWGSLIIRHGNHPNQNKHCVKDGAMCVNLLRVKDLRKMKTHGCRTLNPKGLLRHGFKTFVFADELRCKLRRRLCYVHPFESLGPKDRREKWHRGNPRNPENQSFFEETLWSMGTVGCSGILRVP